MSDERANDPGYPRPDLPGLARFLASLGPDGRRCLVAFSGGPDSAALLAAAAEQAPRCGLELGACWVDHGLRPEDELEAERAFVTEFCRSLGVPLRVKTIPRGAVAARAKGRGIEDAARRLRYAALEEARAEGAWDLILTAHTADDAAETMIMRFLSGSGAAGIRGIPAASGRVRRPLLHLGKAELLAWLAARGLGYRVDSTNETGAYLRNRVRRDLLPVIRDLFPGYRRALEAASGKAAADEEALGGMARTLAAGGRIDLDAFLRAPVAVRERALYILADGAGVAQPGDRVPWRLVRQAASRVPEPGRPAVLATGAGLEACSDGFSVCVRAVPERQDGPAVGFSCIVTGPGEYRIGSGLAFELRRDAAGLRSDAVSWPFVIRSRRPGDAMACAGGLKRLDDLLGELGIPSSLRDRVPLVEDRDGLAAVLGSCLGSRDVYRRNDRLKPGDAPGHLAIVLKGIDGDYAVRR